METKELMLLNSVPTIESYAYNLPQKLQMCKLLRESGFVPAGFKNDGSVLAAILYGQELGFSPIQSLHSIDVIQGKPTVNAQGLKAMILAAGGVIKEIEWTDKVCTLEGYRDGNKQSASFTIQEAAQMGLASKDNWRKMPKLMLYARAVSILARNQWADKIKGLYSKEEMHDSVQSYEPPKDDNGNNGAPAVITADSLPPSPTTIDEAMAMDTQPENDVWTGQEVVTGGKYKDSLWCELPADYLEYIRHRSSKITQINAEKEISRREEAQYAIHEKINAEAAKAQDDFDKDELPSFNLKGE